MSVKLPDAMADKLAPAIAIYCWRCGQWSGMCRVAECLGVAD